MFYLVRKTASFVQRKYVADETIQLQEKEISIQKYSSACFNIYQVQLSFSTMKETELKWQDMSGEFFNERAHKSFLLCRFFNFHSCTLFKQAVIIEVFWS